MIFTSLRSLLLTSLILGKEWFILCQKFLWIRQTPILAEYRIFRDNGGTRTCVYYVLYIHNNMVHVHVHVHDSSGLA
jgi:hypothetical protein